MKDQRGKRIIKGTKVAALVAVGAQVIGKVQRITPDGLLFEAEVALPVMPQQPAGAMVLVDEGVDEIQKEKWLAAKSRKLKIMDQRDNEISEGDDIVALMPQGLQIVGTVTEATDPQMYAGRSGKGWKHGSLTLKAYIPLAIVNSRAPCLLVPPEEKEDSSRRDDAGIIVVN